MSRRHAAEKREVLRDNITGFIPPISMVASAHLRRKGVSPMSLLVLQLLVREKKIEQKRGKPVDNLRVPSWIRRDLRISNKIYLNSLASLESADAIKINEGRKRTASILIDTDTQVREVWEDMYGNKTESRW